MLLRSMLFALALLAPLACHAQDTLEKVVILTRHGVRAPMSSPEQLGDFSIRPWPRFDVPAGDLTANGAVLEQRLGQYNRERYIHDRLLQGDTTDCARVYLHANRTQRTLATAQALASTLLPDCKATVHQAPENTEDPLFEGPAAFHTPDAARKMAAAISGRIGGDPVAWNAAQADAIDGMQRLLLQCGAGTCPQHPIAGKQRLDAVPIGLPSSARGIPGIEGPVAKASGISESLLMAWADGRDFDALGWSGLDDASLLRAFAPHQAEFALRLRAPDVARMASSHLAARLLATLAQGSGVHTPYQSIGGQAPMVILSGHDGTLTMLAGLFDLHWQLPGYQPDQTPPGGALVFERWRQPDGHRVIRARYTAQTLDQLRRRSPLTLDAPPPSSPLYIPGCPSHGSSHDCPMADFARLAQARIDPAFVVETD
ncbi:histidine-type phosphatase [Pseudoxanthomonas sp.]|uniref:histidine-type phosphatase n=1 Tax=Pseudoxanthomonas sp. TaxID=1871049 RepID=UPI00262815B8|nr:histidine-type phosphatase [Pseudoxanthomonas sp.]WDS36554.1 MAG: histidine-type phosphatase [Pseudoxanthomonas sp.]